MNSHARVSVLSHVREADAFAPESLILSIMIPRLLTARSLVFLGGVVVLIAAAAGFILGPTCDEDHAGRYRGLRRGHLVERCECVPIATSRLSGARFAWCAWAER